MTIAEGGGGGGDNGGGGWELLHKRPILYDSSESLFSTIN